MLYEVEVDCRIDFVISVNGLHEEDKRERPWGIRRIPVIAENKEEAKEKALNKYHRTNPIKVLEHFDIRVEAYELSYKLVIDNYTDVLDAQTLADATGDSCKFRATLNRAMQPFSIYDQITVFTDDKDNFSFRVIHSSSVLLSEKCKKFGELEHKVEQGLISREEADTKKGVLEESCRPYVKGVDRHGTGQEMSVSIGSQEGIYYAIHT